MKLWHLSATREKCHHLFKYLFFIQSETLFSADTSFTSLFFFFFGQILVHSHKVCRGNVMQQQNSPVFSSGLFNAPPSLTKPCPKFGLSLLFSLSLLLPFLLSLPVFIFLFSFGRVLLSFDTIRPYTELPQRVFFH